MLPVSAYNEPRLLSQLRTGSEAAFTCLFEHYHGKIYAVGLKFLKSPAMAEEIVQDVFLKLWLKRLELPEIQHFDNYLFIMARNCIFDRLKKMGYEAAVFNNTVATRSPADEAEYLVRHHECQQLLQEAIDLLPPQQKQVYHFARVLGMSHDMIAGKMSISRLTVKSHMAKALQFIRQYLNTRLSHTSTWPLLAFTLAGY